MISNIIGAVVISIVSIINWKKLLDKKINFKDYRLYLGFIGMVLLLIVNFFSVNSIIKTLLVIIIFIFSIAIIFRLPLSESLLPAFFNQLIYIISEVTVIISVSIVMNINDNSQLVENFFGTIYANIIISLIVYIITLFPFLKRCYDKIYLLTKIYRVYNIIILVFVTGATASLLFNLIYYTNNLVILSLGGLLMLIFYLVFIFKSISIRNDYLIMYSKYNSTLESLKAYEDVLDKYKVSNHENKNQLLMIRNMLGKDTKNAVGKYIDKIVKNEYLDDENLMMETSKIPAGGLRALIYSKLLYMKNNNLNFQLKVDRKIRSIQLIELDEKIILDVCKIVGVFLDNAIEEVKKIGAGIISIEIYMLEDKFNISVANTFEGSINLDRIDEIKYTTKGKGHGYGLTLVKEIISNNRNLENIRKINDDIFMQILRISM